MTPPYFPVDDLALTGPMGLVPGSIDGPDGCGQAELVTRENWRTRREMPPPRRTAGTTDAGVAFPDWADARRPPGLLLWPPWSPTKPGRTAGEVGTRNRRR